MPLDASISPIDESFYFIRENEKIFFKEATGIDDDEGLRKHICEIQAQAYSMFPWPSICVFSFLNFQLCSFPVYDEILKLGKERSDAIYLEIGCAFGTDLRKLHTDGYPLENIIASDIEGGYYYLGHRLFKTTPETYPFAFIPGDIFELASELAEPKAPTQTITAESLPHLPSLISLNPLQNRVSVLHASNVFHILPPEKQQKLAHIFANLLSPSSGSFIVGKQLGTESGIYKWNFRDAEYAWAYSISAWKDLWMGENGPFRADEVDSQVSDHVISTKYLNGISSTGSSSGTPSIKLMTWTIRRV